MIPPLLHLHSAEYDDHRIVTVNPLWVKWWVRYDDNTTHVIVGDGYSSNDYPVECLPVTEAPHEIEEQWEGLSHATNPYGPTPRPAVF